MKKRLKKKKKTIHISQIKRIALECNDIVHVRFKDKLTPEQYKFAYDFFVREFPDNEVLVTGTNIDISVIRKKQNV